jgi:hypothetical protein
MTWGSEQMDHVGAWMMSVVPGGIDTLGWDETYKVSYGQAAAASNAQLVANYGFLGGAIGMLINPIGAGGSFATLNDPSNPMNKQNFNILDDKQHKAAFEDSVYGKIASGIPDALWDVFADPTIVGGKLTSVVRTGTRLGQFGGLSDQALRTVTQVRSWSDRIDKGVQYAATGGKEGKWTPEIEHVQDLISKRADQLDNNPLVRSSPNKPLLLRLAAQVDPEDLATGAALAKAGAGDAAGWASLRARSVSLYDQMSNGMGVDPLEKLPGVAGMSADQVQYGTRLVDDALALLDRVWAEQGRTAIGPTNRAIGSADNAATDVARNVGDAVETVGKKGVDVPAAAADAAPETMAAGQLITRGGNRVSASMAHAANAYRKGAADVQFGAIHQGPIITHEGPVFAKSQWVATTLEHSAGSRPIRVLRWFGQGTPSGVVHLKGGDGDTSLDEIKAFLGKSKIQSDQRVAMYAAYVQAPTPTARKAVVESMEEAEAVAIAHDHGISVDTAKFLYDTYTKSRGRHLATMRAGKNGFAVDDSNSLVTTPGLYTELDEAFPMMDQSVFDKVTHQNAGWMQGIEDVTLFADTVNTWWKLSVLLRLGYTERNVTEGFLRSLATMGTVAANPSAMLRLPANMVYWGGSRRLRGSLRHQEKALIHAYDNVTLARDELRKAVDDLSKGKYTAGTWSGSERYVQLQSEIERLTAEIDDTVTKLRAKDAKRVRGGHQTNTMDDGAEMQGAFQGPEGDIAALLSSADRTARTTFDNSFEARKAAQDQGNLYRAMDPKTMKPGEAQQYWDEYTIRLNGVWRHDSIIQSWLAQEGTDAGVIVENTKRWLMSPAGGHYRQSMTTRGGHVLDIKGRASEAGIEKYLSELWHQFEKELPEETGLRAKLASGSVTPAEVAAAYGIKRTPPAIPVRDVTDIIPNLATRAHDGVRGVANKIMVGIGSFPETALVRHPFYNGVYTQRQKELYNLAKAQGQDISSGTVKARINKAAHQDALRATKSTMYTIERLSNAAQLLRWVAPFFPAFENAIRTWGRIVYQNPAVLGYGNLLWNVPNSLGWVYDKDGNKVETSNMFKDDGHKVIMPQKYQEWLINHLPDTPFLNPGDLTNFRQAGYNVILPGAEWWWPGVGPMAQTATVLVLRHRPELADIIRANTSPEMFNNIVPGGDPNVDIPDLWTPTIIKRVEGVVFKNTSEDGAYLTLTNTMVEDAYIDAQISGKTLTDADMKKINDRVNKFWDWSIGQAAVGFTASVGYQSKYAPQRAYWQTLLDDESLSYDQKTKAFLDKFDTKFIDSSAYLAVTRSGSMNEYGLQPNQSTWKKINGNPDLVERLANIDPELVGMFGNMGSFDDPFSYSVYGELRRLHVGNDNNTARHTMTPQQLNRNNQIADGWNEWNQVQQLVTSEVEKAGFKSVNAPGAEQFKAVLDDTKKTLSGKYPAWGEEKVAYLNMTPTFILGARLLTQNAGLVGEDTTISALREYLGVRDMVSHERAATNDNDLKGTLNNIAWEAAAKLRNSDIGFADFYDRYLADDDFREI